MQRIVEVGDARVVAIHRHQILGQIVGADRNEIDARLQLRDHKQHRRHFNHHADARFGDHVAQHLFYFTSGALDQPHRVVDLVDMADHRQQNAEVAGGGVGAQHGAHLHQKNLRLIERQANAAPAEARILFADRHVGQLFIGADVERAQRDRLVVKQLQHALILRHLLLFGREAVLQHKGNFGAVETDAVHPAIERLFMLGAEASVKHHLDALAAFQLARLIDYPFRHFAQRVLFADQALILLHQHRLGID